MNTKHLLVINLALCGALTAQSGTTPPGYDTKSGAGYCYIIGYYAASRCQVANADLRGKGAKVINEISFRQDESLGNAAGVARSWTNVTLQVAETSVAKMSSTWTANHLTTPTVVFSGTRSWPAFTKPSPTNPGAWDVGDLRFPFSSLWIYTAVQDLLYDFTLSGGKLANGNTWGPGSSGGKSYYMDGVTYSPFASGSQSRAGLNVRTSFPCAKDGGSTATFSWNGLSYFYHNSYAKITGDAKTANKMSHYFRARYFMPNIPVVQAASLGGTVSTSDPKFPVIPGLGCHPLMVDLNPGKLILLNFFKTDSSGSAITKEVFYNYIPAAVGLNVYTQVLWADTVSKGSKLSWVGRTTIKAQPGNPTFNGKWVWWWYDNTPTAGTKVPDSVRYPIIRYNKK